MDQKDASSDPEENQTKGGVSTAGYTLGGVNYPLESDSACDFQPGTIIDDFIVLKKIGAGGWGVVYKAQQRSIPRDVALKLINPRMAVEGIFDRFENEKVTLASLNHPNIVNIIAGGKTSPELGSQPFFAMEYVEGQPITKYADKNKFSVRKRLELFIQVCEGIECAHQRAVIHRDIKPSNILVTEKLSGDPLVKVIDFGIAKAVNNGLPVAYATQTGQMIGTPAYMSPQQTGKDPALVNESSDIYSLGVLLYELLVGRLPLDINGKQAAQIKAILKSIPAPPSARIKEKDDKTFFSVGRKRGIDLLRLEKLLKGDLDRIVLKCLEKCPEDRYETVDDLVADIRGFLVEHDQDAGIDGGGQKGIHKNVFWVVGLGTVILAIFAIVFGNHISANLSTPLPTNVPSTNPPDISTPEGLLAVLYNSELYNTNTTFVYSHVTETGSNVWTWLMQQVWFKEKGIGKIVDRLNDGREQSLVIEYESVHGVEKVAPVFFVEDGTLKFHDLHIYELMGDKYDMDLSAWLKNPDQFKKRYRELNPVKGPEGNPPFQKAK